VANGLALLGDQDDLVMVHDAARPALSAAVIDRLLLALTDDSVAGAIPALPVADTLARGDTELGEIVARDALWRVQTPQAFRASALRLAHEASAAASATDDAQLVRANGGRVLMVAGETALEKVTQAGDLERLSRQMVPAAVSTRTGMGFDVHRLVPGDGVWLGGVLIPHDRKLLGHSDADVALHAITDAILGAVAAGDIGDHFPPSDPQWAGARSDQFLVHAARLATEVGCRITHIDCTIICEAPRIGPYRQAIRESIAAILRLPINAISVKATTTEKLGFTGRGEGIAAQAIATLQGI
jgi:2-C-methyl-D-erythritol 4-phosphate cytidylyltransferase / 2-C-methyl-D-erythritol 2,4-cyclodiphosphate synthase